MVDVVGSPEASKLTEQIGLFVIVLGGTQPVHGIRSGLLADFQHLVADFVDCLFPGDLLPLAAFLLHRIFQPAFAMSMFADRSTFGAMSAQIEWTVKTRFLTDPDTIFHFRKHRTANRTMSADRFDDLHIACTGRNLRICFLHCSRHDGGERYATGSKA